MTKKKWLKKLDAALRGMDKSERKRILEYYGEMIDDLKEDGKTEAEAVAGLGAPERIAARELNENRPAAVKKERRGMPLWLIIIGSPLWFALFIVAFCLGITAVAVTFSLLVTAVAVELSLAACGLFCLVTAIPLFTVNFHTALLVLGAALILIALPMLLYSPLLATVKGLWKGAGVLLKKIFKRSV